MSNSFAILATNSVAVLAFIYVEVYPHRLPRDNQRDLKQQTQFKKSTGGNRVKIPVWEQLATDQTDL